MIMIHEQALIQDFVREGGWLAPKIFGALLGGSEACSPRKFLKLKVPDWLKMHFLAPLQ